MIDKFDNLPSRETISPTQAGFNACGVCHGIEANTRAGSRGTRDRTRFKRNAGRKVKTLRSHRLGSR